MNSISQLQEPRCIFPTSTHIQQSHYQVSPYFEVASLNS